MKRTLKVPGVSNLCDIVSFLAIFTLSPNVNLSYSKCALGCIHRLWYRMLTIWVDSVFAACSFPPSLNPEGKEANIAIVEITEEAFVGGTSRLFQPQSKYDDLQIISTPGTVKFKNKKIPINFLLDCVIS